MTAKIIELKKPLSIPEPIEKPVHVLWCDGCSKSKEAVKVKVRRLHRDYAKEFSEYYLAKLNEKNLKISFEHAHILLYMQNLLDEICRNTAMGELLLSNECPNKVLDKYWDKVAWDYFLVRYIKSWNSLNQCLTFSRWCYMSWYELNRLNNLIGHILYDHLEEFLEFVPDFNDALDFEIRF
ncbi:MAG: hypothetical protein ACD_3C00042G0008 [uncultured bacterium (gcode 4)]|uniref:Uncharacterized protein n=1 Tax=uncultured bacterium (gcode 4) TaxID=1234023 RepID=K2G074_9BACT|nr:MAG: hypothetical protein ACD_3C00042G0008 [uncultured bacterium (gcode 4)]